MQGKKKKNVWICKKYHGY